VVGIDRNVGASPTAEKPPPPIRALGAIGAQPPYGAATTLAPEKPSRNPFYCTLYFRGRPRHVPDVLPLEVHDFVTGRKLSINSEPTQATRAVREYLAPIRTPPGGRIYVNLTGFYSRHR
jgi:hypothetical protein